MQGKQELNDNCYVMGDFNLPGLTWCFDDDENNCELYLLPTNVHKEEEICVVDNLISVGLAQVTCVKNRKRRMLDLIFTNDWNNVSTACSKDNLLPDEAHQFAIEIKIEIEIPLMSDTIVRKLEFNFTRANYLKMNQLISDVNWIAFFENCDINECTGNFYKMMRTFISGCVPMKTVLSTNHPKYFKKHLINLKNRTNKAHKAYKSCNDTDKEFTYKFYSDLRKELKAYSSVAYNNFIEETESAIKVNLRRFFNYVNEKRKTSRLPQKMYYDESESCDASEISNFLLTILAVNLKLTAVKR